MSSSNPATSGTHAQWTYDRYGNRLGQTITAGAGGAQPILSIDATTNRISSSGFLYDAAGNMLWDGVHSGMNPYPYQYDADGKLVVSPDGSIYSYDAFGRLAVTVDAVGTFQTLVYGRANRRLAVLNNANSTVTYQIYSGNQPIAFDSNNQLTYQYQNQVGSEGGRLQAGTLTTFASMPFGDGQQMSAGGTDQDTYHFAGLDNLPLSPTTMHATFRDYHPVAARWMSPDPYDGSYDISNPQSLNRYAYVLNSPLAYSDPTGLYSFWSGNCQYTTQQESIGEIVNGVYTLLQDQVPYLDFCLDGGGGGAGAGPGGGPGGGAGGGPAPSNATCAGKTVSVGNNFRIQSNGQGMITGVGVVLTGPSGYQSGGSGGYTSIAPNTILGVSLGSGGALNIGLSNPLYFKPGGAGAFTGAYISGATFNNGSFSQVSGAVAFEGIPFGSRYTPSNFLANQLNQNSSLTNVAQLVQSAAKLAQSLVGCSVVVGH